MRSVFRVSIALMLLGVGVFISPPVGATAVPLQNGTADFSQNGTNFSAAASIDGSTADLNGWAVDPKETTPHTAVFETVTDTPVFVGGTLFTFTFDQFLARGLHELGRFRISITTDSRSNFADGLQTGGDVTANWIVLDPLTFTSANGATLTKQGDMSILASGTTPSTDTYTVTAATALTGITGIRIEVIPDASLPNGGSGRNSAPPPNGNFVLTEFLVDAVASPVPEPSTLSLVFGAALVGLFIRRRIARA
jgi:hypothetical protein